MGNINRRDFLRLGGLGILAAAAATNAGPVIDAFQNTRVELMTGVDWKEQSWSEIDFVSNPEILVDNSLAMNRFEKDFTGASEYLGKLWNRMATKIGDPAILENYDPEKHKENNLHLATDVISWAKNVDFVRKNQLNFVEKEVVAKYQESATYLRSMLMMYEHFRALPEDEVDRYFESLDWDETLDDVLSYPSLNDPAYGDLRRGEILANWNYSWKDLIANGIGNKPLLPQLFGWKDNSEVGIYLGISGDYLGRGPLNAIDSEQVNGVQRPRETKYIDMDPEVSSAISEKLRVHGLERTISSISIDKTMGLVYARTPGSGESGEVFLGSPLTMDNYLKYQRLVDSRVFHELFHVIEARAIGDGGQGLPDEELFKFRDLQLKLLDSFDPLRSMKMIFNPNGDYLPLPLSIDDLSEYANKSELNLNEMNFNDYYIQSIEDVQGLDLKGRNLWAYSDEFKLGVLKIGNTYIERSLGLLGKDETLTDIFDRIESSRDQLLGIPKLIVEIMLESRDDIVKRKRMTFSDEKTDLEYFSHKVIPYTIMHIGMYRFDELLVAAEAHDNPEAMMSFLNSWRIDMDRFLRGHARPAGEFSADIFSGAFIDDAGNIDWGDTREICTQMINLLQKNGLALNKQQEEVA